MRPAKRKRLARKKAKYGGWREVKVWMHHWLIPPGLWEIGRRFVRRERAANRGLSPPQNPTPLVNIFFPRRGDDTLWVPVEKIVNRYGQSFTAKQHHFVRYLESGFDELANFYQIHQPETAAQAHFINESLPNSGRAKWPGSAWLHAHLGGTDTPLVDPQNFGPISDLELAAEAARLDEVLHSVKKYGFLAGNASWAGEQITGQLFYKDDGDFRIVIQNGNHRTAVLAHLGWDLIPVYNQPGRHPVRLCDLERWPGVVDGRFSRETAHAMFEAFFRPRHQQLLPGW